MKLIRSIECGLPGEVSKCIVRYPPLRDLVHNPYDFSGNLSVRLRDLRRHAAELARDHALDELATASVVPAPERGEEEGGGRWRGGPSGPSDAQAGGSAST